MAQGLKRDKALQIAGMSKDRLYYKPTGKKGGVAKSESTNQLVKKVWEEKSNKEVLSTMKSVKENPLKGYGYRKMTYELQQSGYLINHKKVYRLMKEADLLEAKREKGKKAYVKYRIVTPEGPLEVLEMDIKQVWVEDQGKYAYILTILDTFTRVALHWSMGYRMRWGQVQQAWEEVIREFLQPNDCLRKGLHIEVRNDNGPQFGAKAIKDFFLQNHLCQVFTHPYTPQENGHIESFHGILAKHLNRSAYWTLEQLEQDLTIFYENYNNHRLHASTAYLPPNRFWAAWGKGLISRQVKTNKRVHFKLLLPHYQLSGIENPEGSISLQT